MTLLAALMARWVGASAARVLAPLVLVGAIAAAFGGAWALHGWWARRQIAEAVTAATEGLVQAAELAAAEARAAAAERTIAAERRASAALAASAADAAREADALLAELNRYIEEHPDAPADCTVGPDLLQLLRR